MTCIYHSRDRTALSRFVYLAFRTASARSQQRIAHKQLAKEATCAELSLAFILQHEDLSLRMLDYVIEENELWPEFVKYGLDETDLVFIKELIHNSGAEKKDGVSAAHGFLLCVLSDLDGRRDGSRTDSRLLAGHDCVRGMRSQRR